MGRSDSDERTMPAPIPPFAAASAAERIGRIAEVENLRRAKASELGRWRNPASHQAGWGDRGRILAGFVRPGERVFEFGAGASVVAAALPSGCHYVGSDAVPLRESVVRFDLNAATLPQLSGHDLALFSGVLEYVHDLDRLTTFLARAFRSVICSYAVVQEATPEEFARRRYSGWFNDLDQAAFRRLFQAAGYALTRESDWCRQSLSRWDRSGATGPETGGRFPAP